MTKTGHCACARSSIAALESMPPDAPKIKGRGCVRSVRKMGSNCGRSVSRNGWRATDGEDVRDRKSTRLNSSHVAISYAVFCLKKKKNQQTSTGKLYNNTNSHNR